MTHHSEDRAVVLGAGMAGLFAARALTTRYAEVVVVERDDLAGDGVRKGVPQGRHAHALLARGYELLEVLFPGLHRELADAGVSTCDLAGELRWYFGGHRLRQAHSGVASLNAMRPTVEAHVRRRVAALPEVSFRTGTAVQGLEFADGGKRVVGVRLSGPGAEPEVLPSAVVVDATGRGSRLPVWLGEQGYRRPAEERVPIDLAYTTRTYRLADDPYGTDWSINSVASPRNPRGAFFARHPGGIAQLSLTGMLGDHPPRDEKGFLEFARSLDAPEIYESVRRAEPLDDPVTFRVPASVRRRFESLDRFPAGLLALGDSVCAFNPVYGQGMTVAVMEAAELMTQLADGEPDPLRFFGAIAPVIDVPWGMSTSGDLTFPGVPGKRGLAVRLGNAYMARVHTAARHDGRFTAAFFRVAGLVDPPQTLMRPGMVLRLLRAALPSRGPVASVTPLRPPSGNPARSDRAA